MRAGRIKCAAGCISELLNSAMVLGFAAFLSSLTPDKIEKTQAAYAYTKPTLSNVALDLKKGDSFIGVLKRSGISEVFKKHC